MNQQRLQKVLDNMKQAGLRQLLVTETGPASGFPRWSG